MPWERHLQPIGGRRSSTPNRGHSTRTGNSRRSSKNMALESVWLAAAKGWTTSSSREEDRQVQGSVPEGIPGLHWKQESAWGSFSGTTITNHSTPCEVYNCQGAHVQVSTQQPLDQSTYFRQPVVLKVGSTTPQRSGKTNVEASSYADS